MEEISVSSIQVFHELVKQTFLALSRSFFDCFFLRRSIGGKVAPPSRGKPEERSAIVKERKKKARETRQLGWLRSSREKKQPYELKREREKESFVRFSPEELFPRTTPAHYFRSVCFPRIKLVGRSRKKINRDDAERDDREKWGKK